MAVTRPFARPGLRVPLVLAVSTLLGAGPMAQQAVAKPPSPPKGAASGWRSGDGMGRQAPDRVPAAQRDSVLGAGYRSSEDRAWTTSGDGTGFHVLVADAEDGYRWRTAASLSENGFDTDTWVGNACLTGSGKHAVVAYAPRTFTNKPKLMGRGAFAAVVNLDTGKITKLPRTVSLAYFSPGCGTGDSAVLSQFSDGELETRETRLITVDATDGTMGKPLKLSGQVTSAVPTPGGIVAAAGHRLVKVGRTGKLHSITTTRNTPFQLKADAGGGVTFIDRAEQTTKKKAQGIVKRVGADQVRAAGTARSKGTSAAILARGNLVAFDLASTAQGKVFITGKAKQASTARMPRTVTNPGGIEKDAVLSTRGRMAVSAHWADGKDTRIRPEEALTARTVTIDMRGLTTRGETTLQATPGAALVSGSAQVHEPSPALTMKSSAASSSSGSTGGVTPLYNISEPTSERYCSVPRGDPQKQAFQPKPRQVEWAVDQAVTGNLDKHILRPANWKNTGMAGYRPQALAGGLTPLLDGGHIPPQIMLGITAQESNMWQATRFAAPGVTANPLIGNYYGVSHDDSGETTDEWAINWPEADCGYGVAQVTDGMRLDGKEKEGENALAPIQQEAIALDYTANIAFGVNILASKWNQTRAAGMIVNNGAASSIENWFFALWAYNSGFYPQSATAENKGKWGVGWFNNPANPTWKANRTPFLENDLGGDDYSHAAHPQDWPYPEKVIGWAARPLEALEAPDKLVVGYRPAWWLTGAYRTSAKPPVDLFCDSSNECDPGKIQDGDSNDSPELGACQRTDWYCWWHKPVIWKYCDSDHSECGFELLRFDSTYAEQTDGNSHPPSCAQTLPSSTLIVDNVNNGQRLAGSDLRRCTDTAQSAGQFAFDFQSPSARMDVHQVGAGQGNHFWFSHTRDDEETRLKVTGTWTLGSDIDGWARVLVHMPSIAARTQKAHYEIHGTDSTSPVRVAPQRTRENRWVDLGVFRFTGTPKVSLSNVTPEGNGSIDVAWDAVAFHKLPGKPQHQIVAMGDSYASGEGATTQKGDDYYRETDYEESFGDKTVNNRCHRSKKAWIRQATLPGMSTSIGTLSDSFSDDLSLNFIACSGARTYNILSTSKGGAGGGSELPQIKQGYLDQNTTMVTLNIGGNDARFSDIVKECILPWQTAIQDCRDTELKNIDPDTGAETEGKTGDLSEYVPAWITNEVKPRITSTLQEIRSKAPNARIVLMGYPPLLTAPDGACAGVDFDEATWLNEEMAPHLAMEMASAAASVGAQFVNPVQEFSGKAICGDPETIHGIVLNDMSESDTTPQSMKSFHPKVAGARLFADAFERGLQ